MIRYYNHLIHFHKNVIFFIVSFFVGSFMLNAQEQSTPAPQQVTPVAQPTAPVAQPTPQRTPDEYEKFNVLFTYHFNIGQRFLTRNSNECNRRCNNFGAGFDLEFGNLHEFTFMFGFRSTYTRSIPISKHQYQALVYSSNTSPVSVEQYNTLIAQNNVTVKQNHTRWQSFILGFNKYFRFGYRKRNAIYVGLGWGFHRLKQQGDVLLKVSNLDNVYSSSPFKQTLYTTSGVYGRIGYLRLFENGFAVGVSLEYFTSLYGSATNNIEIDIPEANFTHRNLLLTLAYHF